MTHTLTRRPIYTITPSSGYAVSDVQVDGSSVGAVSTYTFSNVTVNHTISATFAGSSNGGIFAYVPNKNDNTVSVKSEAAPSFAVVTAYEGPSPRETRQCRKFFTFYSYRRASIGFRRDAL